MSDVVKAENVEAEDDVQDTGSNIRVFVYGTLKTGHGNNRALRGSKMLGRAYIEGMYTLVGMGWYPGLIRAGTANRRIYGEVWLINEDTLHTLDLIEGHPNFYERIKVRTPWKNTWVYTLDESYLGENPEVIEAGIWKPSAEELEYVSSCQAAV